MIYVRLRGKVGEIFPQIIFAEKLAQQYNQEIRLYTNGSYDNNKEYYENELIPGGIFLNYNFVDTYPISEEVLFEDSPNFEEEIARRGANGQDIVIEGDFYQKQNFDYIGFRNKFFPSAELLDFMDGFGITPNSLYIEARPLLVDNKDEFALAGKLLEIQLAQFKNRDFDKVFVKTDWPDFFMTAGFEEITGVENIAYVVNEDLPLKYRTATDVMFPYRCKSCVISNYASSWWGHAMNAQQGHEAGILFPYGKIKRIVDAPDGISEKKIINAIFAIANLSGEEKRKQKNGESSLFDNVFFERELENIENETNNAEQ